MVAVDEEGRPTAVAPLIAETVEERRREREAQVRRRNRLAEREDLLRQRD
jgi:acyl-CoA hydrolase